MDLEMEIVEATPDFNFKAISLADPQPLNGSAGFYFTQLTTGEENKALCLQLPECVTKQGIVNIKNGKYLDLMFERSNHDELMHWIEQLEYTCQDIIDSKKDLWFQTELTRDDIETMMTQVTRLYQSGKYMLMRVFVDIGKTGNSKCIAYDENEIGFDLELLEANKPVIPLVMIEGVKFSSRSFEISLKLVQVMVIGQNEKKSTCLIKRQADIAASSESVKPVPVVKAEPLVKAEPVVKPLPVVKVDPTVKAQPQPTVKAQPQPIVKAQPQPIVKTQPVVKPHTVTKPEPVKIEKKSINPPALESKPQVTIKLPELVPSNTVAIVKDPNEIDPNEIDPNEIDPNEIDPNEIDPNEIEEITIDYDTVENDSISLKHPNEVYLELYKKAREKAKQCRIAAIEAYLEAKQIKTKYMLFDEEESDDDISDDDITDEED